MSEEFIPGLVIEKEEVKKLWRKVRKLLDRYEIKRPQTNSTWTFATHFNCDDKSDHNIEVFLHYYFPAIKVIHTRRYAIHTFGSLNNYFEL